MQHPLDADILVDLLPVHILARTDDLVVRRPELLEVQMMLRWILYHGGQQQGRFRTIRAHVGAGYPAGPGVANAAGRAG